MSLTATWLLLISAFSHAGWNFISKKEHPSQAFYLVANTLGVICVAPILYLYWHVVGLIPRCVWLIAALSGFLLAAYLQALAGAYRNGDMSIAYPLARALPVFFVFLLTLILGKGQMLSGWFILGATFIVGGCIILPMPAFSEFHFTNYKNPCCFLAVVAAVGISGYTVADDTALRYLREIAGKTFTPVEGTLVYMVLEGISCSLWQSLFVAFSSRERQNLADVLLSYRGPAALTGIGIYLTYGLVLVSMNYVSNVSYVAAFRQLSIPLGALFSIALLKEPRHIPKIAGVVIIFLGLVVVGMK